MDELRISTHNSIPAGKFHLSIQPHRSSPSYHRFSHLRSSHRQHSSDPEDPLLSPAVEMSYQPPRFLDENKSQNNASFSATAPPCLECVSDCTEPSCSADEITPQCTDQCVVIACTDPTHSEMACHDSENSHCDLVCDGALGCTDCTGFDEFLRCCTDYHSYFSEPRNHVSEPTSSSWDPTYDSLLCACAEPEPPSATDELASQFQYMSSDDTSQYSSDMDTSGFHPSHSSPAISVAGPSPHALLSTPNSPPFLPSPPPSILNCMWGNCQAQFTSLAELVGHVNLQHLRLPSPSIQQLQAQSSMQYQLQPESSSDPSQIESALYQGNNDSLDALSCLWGDCHVYPSAESIPGPSSGNHLDSALGVLASHLLQDHLGISGRSELPLAVPVPPQDPRPYNEGAVTTIPIPAAPPPAVNQNSIPSSTSSSTSTPPPPEHKCTGKHTCHWQACSETFTSCSDLTSHLTAAHVGSGKAHYECFWDGCNRSGDHGFTSKQKICRHLQSHTGHRPFQCKVCNQNFSEAATLQQHMRRHTQEKPYLCDFPGCGKSFAITGALTIHKRTHNGYKPFKCTYCDRAFSESSNLSKHLRTHTGARPYACMDPGCGKAFARPDQLTRHMGVHRKRDALQVGTLV